MSFDQVKSIPSDNPDAFFDKDKMTGDVEIMAKEEERVREGQARYIRTHPDLQAKVIQLFEDADRWGALGDD